MRRIWASEGSPENSLVPSVSSIARSFLDSGELLSPEPAKAYTSVLFVAMGVNRHTSVHKVCCAEAVAIRPTARYSFLLISKPSKNCTFLHQFFKGQEIRRTHPVR